MYTIGEERKCPRKLENQHSRNAISIHSMKTNRDNKNNGHTPDALAKVFHGLMSEWKLLQVKVKTDKEGIKQCKKLIKVVFKKS